MSKASKKTKPTKVSEPAENEKLPTSQHFLLSKIAREFGASYSDPFTSGTASLANYFDAFVRFLRDKYPENNAKGTEGFQGLITNCIEVQLSDRPTVSISYQLSKGLVTICVPRIPNQTIEDEAARIERLAMNTWSTLPIGIFEIVTEIIRGLPEEGRANLLRDYAFDQRKGSN